VRNLSADPPHEKVEGNRAHIAINAKVRSERRDEALDRKAG